jgi:hypothetical protein
VLRAIAARDRRPHRQRNHGLRRGPKLTDPTIFRVAIFHLESAPVHRLMNMNYLSCGMDRCVRCGRIPSRHLSDRSPGADSHSKAYHMARGSSRLHRRRARRAAPLSRCRIGVRCAAVRGHHLRHRRRHSRRSVLQVAFVGQRPRGRADGHRSHRDREHAELPDVPDGGRAIRRAPDLFLAHACGYPQRVRAVVGHHRHARGDRPDPDPQADPARRRFRPGG